jgi:hypothetical protein
MHRRPFVCLYLTSGYHQKVTAALPVVEEADVHGFAYLPDRRLFSTVIPCNTLLTDELRTS